MRAARSRRRSIPLKSRGSLVGGWCAVVAAISPPLPQPGLLRGLWHTSVSPYSEKLLSLCGPGTAGAASAARERTAASAPGQGCGNTTRKEGTADDLHHDDGRQLQAARDRAALPGAARQRRPARSADDAAVRLAGLGLRIVGAMAGWVLRRPRWLAPLRLAALAVALVLVANVATAPSTAGHQVTTTTPGTPGGPPMRFIQSMWEWLCDDSLVD